jgi:hypothetical protein
MPYGIEYDVPAPIQFYDTVHAEVLQRGGSSVDGLLLHVGRPSDGGFQVLEGGSPGTTGSATTTTSSGR